MDAKINAVAVVMLFSAALPVTSLRAEGRNAAKMTTELAHVGQAIMEVSDVLSKYMRKHPDERSVGTYASKVAASNISLIKSMRPPREARMLHKYLLEMAEVFSSSVEFFRKGDIENVEKMGRKIREPMSKAQAEFSSLRNKGLILGGPEMR